jgi:hypothetical protein
VEAWQRSELTDVTAKVAICEAFVEGRLEVPKHLARTVHDLYFEPKYEDFRARTIWSLSNAFTSAFKELDPIPQFKATARGRALIGPTYPSPRLSACPDALYNSSESMFHDQVTSVLVLERIFSGFGWARPRCSIFMVHMK